MKKYLQPYIITLLLITLVLVITSACATSKQTSGGSQAQAQNTPQADYMSSDNSTPSSSTPVATTSTTQTMPLQTTPAASPGKISPTPTVMAIRGSLPTATPNTSGGTIPTPTTQPIVTFTPTPTASISNTSYHQVGTIPLPHMNKSSWSFDISWVDPQSNQYYLADRDNKGIDIFDLNTQKFVTAIGGFAGPNGVLADNLGQLWVGDADSTMKVINLTSRTITATIPTGGSKVTDEIAYDPADQLILASNGDDTVPFVTLISATKYTVVSKIKIADAEGLEQPAWDAQSHLFYISVPKTAQNPGGEIAIIDPQKGSVTNTVALNACNPTGFAIGPNHQALIGCDGHPVIMDLTAWTVVATLNQINGCDEVWYNSGDQHYYLAADSNDAGPVLGIANAQTAKWVQNIPTKSGSHSVAAASGTNIVLVPTVGVGIVLYAPQ